MKIIKTKNIKIDNELLTQVEVLCEILHTNFSSKTKELLVEWKIKELKRLKEDAPELFEKYSNNLGNKKAPWISSRGLCLLAWMVAKFLGYPHCSKSGNSVNTCELILQYIKERENFYDEATSYNYKHHIERLFSQTHIYIGNGDFIQGAINLNLHVKPYNNHIPSDGIFKFTENDFYLASIEYYLNHNKIQLSSNNIITIKNDILNCKNHRSRITIDDFIKLLLKLNIDISKTDIFLLLISDIEVFDWSYSSDKFTSFHDIMNKAKLKINRNQLKTALSK